ncbi:M67 family metallopeptidase [Desulfitobacterium sp. AusDCA]|uniref:M67 family metallopeptidase n=1 Tax=Desulfitobacterium sp. AusDCA TaxID=3240383 RepID=UPI003DA79E2A
MTILLKNHHYQEIISYAREKLPNEACGLLAGRVENDMKIIEEVYYLTNIDQSPEHFSMDPKEQFAAIKAIRSKDWQLLGNFHSHPSSPSRPSQEDIRLAFDPEASYFILSLKDKDKPVLKSFKIKEKAASEEELCFTHKIEPSVKT